MTSGSSCRQLNKPQTEGARRSIQPAYHRVTVKLQHFLLLLVQLGPPATKCHGHTPCAMFLTGTEPRCENLYSSLRSLRSPVQKFRSSRPPFSRSTWAARHQMPSPHALRTALLGYRTSI